VTFKLNCFLLATLSRAVKASKEVFIGATNSEDNELKTGTLFTFKANFRVAYSIYNVCQSGLVSIYYKII